MVHLITEAFQGPLKQSDGTLDVVVDGVTYENVKGKVLIDGELKEGAGITSSAFAKFIPYSGLFLTVAVVLFAVSTMISWSYYGLQSWKYLFGRGKASDLTYKVIFCLFVVIGSAANMSSIWAFSDAMIFAMVFPEHGRFVLFVPSGEKTIDQVSVGDSRRVRCLSHPARFENLEISSV